MLAALHIRNLATVEQLDLELHHGLTVLTGETGAGKSILLTALNLAMGERADTGKLRPGANKLEVNLEFRATDNAIAWLATHELTADSCLIRRIVSADGRSKALINGTVSPLHNLQGLGEHLLEIHGQHAHLQLLDPPRQRQLLDEYGRATGCAEQVRAAYQRWRAVSEALTRQRAATDERQHRQELLRYQINELELAGVDTLDYTALSEEHRCLANIDQILTTGLTQLERLDDHPQLAVTRVLAQASLALGELAQFLPSCLEVQQNLESSLIQVQDACRSLRHLLDAQEADPARLSWIDQRLAALHQLARKLHIHPEQLPAALRAMLLELAELEAGDTQLAELEQALATMLTDYRACATQLSTLRHQAAGQLSSRISELIQQLGMPHGRFEVVVQSATDANPQPHGRDHVTFLVSANAGLPPRPLSKVASGGELSRIALAIKVAAIDVNSTPTLIFDEVDSGIGGGVAEIVGQLLRALGQQRQVLCVTHLPQVAVQGHRHLLVEKVTERGVTTSSVRYLEGDARRREIARMLGGVNITKQTLAHADEMLNWHASAAHPPHH